MTLPKECTESGNPVGCEAIRPIVNPSANAADNRLSSSDGYVFDPAGNTVRDPQSRRFTYDGENKQVMVETLDLNGNPVSTVGEYEYDGDGKRVKKHVPSTGEVTVFVYNAGGKRPHRKPAKAGTDPNAEFGMMNAESGQKRELRTGTLHS